MSKWTKKAAIDRMNTNLELQKVYQEYPLTKLLVESATKFRRYQGYHRISCYYAYKDWVWAATLDPDGEEGWIVVKVIDDLLPPDACDLDDEEGSAIVTNNPSLPGLPSRPEREKIALKESFLEFANLVNLNQMRQRRDKEMERYNLMHQMLLKLQQKGYSK